jgi:hypothetical protein
MPHGIHFAEATCSSRASTRDVVPRPFRVDDWLLYAMTRRTHQAAWFALSGFYSRDGRLVASTAQKADPRLAQLTIAASDSRRALPRPSASRREQLVFSCEARRTPATPVRPSDRRADRRFRRRAARFVQRRRAEKRRAAAIRPVAGAAVGRGCVAASLWRRRRSGDST